MWFDSHCHLHLCADGVADDVVHRAREAGVVEMLTVGIDIGSSLRSLTIASVPGVYASVGVHPNSASDWDETMMSALEDMAGNDRAVAIGETGLDFYRDHTPPAKQKEAFAAHIELAKRSRKALVIHTRDSVDAALDLLAEEGAPERFVFHCWSGNEKQLRVALDLGAYISFAGNVSFSSADDLREVARLVPDERLLVETDSPFLTPKPHRGKPNEPRMVSFVGVAVAAARSVSAHLLGEQTSTNARRLFL